MQIIASALAAVAALGSLTAAAPFTIPAGDGFPTPNTQQLLAIQQDAGGALSNAPPPPKIEATSLSAIALTALNENFETAFFSSLLQNVTDNVEGFQFDTDEKRTEFLDIVDTIVAQEKLHAINAANTLRNFDAFVPVPCAYQFPSSDIRGAVQLAQTFTALVLGTLQDAAQLFAVNGDAGAVRSVASTIGQEGEQEGFFRILLGKKPSEKPFLTTSVAPFLYSYLQQFIVPGSCPFPLSSIPLTIFPALQVLSGSDGTNVTAEDQTLQFKADLTAAPADRATKFLNGDGQGLFVTYLSGQRLPISVPVQDARWEGKTIYFAANLPYTENQMDGLTVAALTNAGSLAVSQVAGAALAAPGLIQIAGRAKAWDENY
ncbi:hypothetical protein B0T17DRAFT_544159 [Bombardia bombarda]|uniref:Late sexual development protein n=1 Tax=Bombardia bombarda TaxID=252184 RepID=A0AA39WD18_9PEZI|nr:hypothetical protein B0T17DRAFT_544159 [Bombardia bombarda]